MVLVPPCQHTSEQQRRMAGYVLREGLPHLARLLQEQEAEVGVCVFGCDTQVLVCSCGPSAIMLLDECCATPCTLLFAHFLFLLRLSLSYLPTQPHSSLRLLHGGSTACKLCPPHPWTSSYAHCVTAVPLSLWASLHAVRPASGRCAGSVQQT